MALKVKDSLVEVPGGCVFVREWHIGNDGNTPIILMHDSLGAVELWRDFPSSLATATSRSVIAYDRLGFGKSSERNSPPSVEFIREEAEFYFPSVIGGMRVKNYILFGHSVGGAMAVNIAAVNPDNCKAVITESAQAFVEERTLSGIRAAKEAFKKNGQFEKLKRWHGEKARWVLNAWTEIWLSQEFRPWSLDLCFNDVRCPVLAIHGDNDEYGSKEFPRRITGGVNGPSQMEILDSCGHVPHREKEGEVLHLVYRFIKKYAIP